MKKHLTNRIQHDIIDEYSRENLLSTDIAGWSSSVARRAHNPKVVSSNLAPATNYDKQITWLLASGVISLSYIKVYINAAAALGTGVTECRSNENIALSTSTSTHIRRTQPGVTCSFILSFHQFGRQLSLSSWGFPLKKENTDVDVIPLFSRLHSRHTRSFHGEVLRTR